MNPASLRVKQPLLRAQADRCPGALTLHEAADGLLARVRLPGGFVDAFVLRGLAQVVDSFGDGRLELTSRGNLQIRAIRAADQDELATRLADLGLLPSLTHERVRNIAASPLAGLDGSGPDLSNLVGELDRAICATAELQQLSGRFLFAIDDGRGDTRELAADVTAQFMGPNRWLVAPAVTGFTAPQVVTPPQVVSTMIGIARAFLAERRAQNSTAWRIADLGSEAVLPVTTLPLPHPAGVIEQSASGHQLGRTLVVIAPLGRLDAAQARLLSELITDRAARITPWRSVVIPDQVNVAGSEKTLRAAGLDVGADSVWNNLTACAGRPGCAKALADVQHDARVAVTLGQRVRGSLAQHWSGCSRRCGHPAGAYVDVLAGTDGYTITTTDGSIPK